VVRSVKPRLAVDIAKPWVFAIAPRVPIFPRSGRHRHGKGDRYGRRNLHAKCALLPSTSIRIPVTVMARIDAGHLFVVEGFDEESNHAAICELPPAER